MKSMHLLFVITILLLFMQSAYSGDGLSYNTDANMHFGGNSPNKQNEVAELVNEGQPFPIKDYFPVIVAIVAIIISCLWNWWMLKQAKEAHTFDAITRIHEAINNKTAYDYRRLLFKYFGPGCWKELSGKYKIVLFQVNTRTDEQPINIKEQLETLNTKQMESLKKEFEEKLKQDGILYDINSGNQIILNYREVIEKTLTTLGYIAIPYYEGIKSAQSAAIAYRTILLRTAPHILPFIAIEKRNRNNDKHYKFHYLYLLKKLEIPLQGIKVPPPPARGAGYKTKN
jgi:hypothetical protein